MTTVLWLVANGIAAPVSAAAGFPVIREYTESAESARLDELMALHGRNKQLPAGYELQALLALSHYPELSDVKIRFVIDDVNIPLASRPHWITMLRSARQRTYLVIIDNARDGSRDALILKNQPFNAQIGVIGHELAHTVYYLERSFFGIVGDALCQLSDCRINFERETDRRLIDYGLGWQRYDHARFLRRSLTGNAEENVNTLEGGGGAYMSPAELLSLIENHAAYAD